MFLKNPKNTTTKKQHTNQNGYFLRQNLALRYNNPLIRDKIDFPSLYKIDQSKDSFC